MKTIVIELNEVVSDFAEKCNRFSEIEFGAKPLPNKWSKKEVLGHLIDSAQNNLRRFICGQYESTPSKIVYEQDSWVNANNYQSESKDNLIKLWVLINQRIGAILLAMPKDSYSKVSDTGRDQANLRSLEWLAADYNKHMKHHLNQIIPNSFDIKYP